MAKPDGWCPKCKEFVEDIYEMLSDGEYYTSYRRWNGEQYEEIDNSLTVAGIEMNTFCSKCDTKITFRLIETHIETKYFLVCEKMRSADDSAEFHYLIRKPDMKAVQDWYKNIHELGDNDDNKYETSCGNIFSLHSITEITEREYNILSKYLDVI